jgi:hypothetical protein
MDVCIITPLFAAFLSPILPLEPLQVTSLFLAAELATHYVARASLYLPLQSTVRMALLALIMAASGLIASSLLLHTETGMLDPHWLNDILTDVRTANLHSLNLTEDIVVLLVVLFLWWRGLVLARRRLTSDSVAFRFRLGVVLLAITTLVGGLILPWSFAGFVFAFFFAGLVGIALARAREVGEQYGGAETRFDLGWLLTLIVAGLTVLVLASGVAALLTGEKLTRFVAPAWTILQTIISAVAYVVGWLVEILVTLVRFLVGDINLESFRRDLSLFREGVVPDVPEPGPSQLTPEQLIALRTAGVVGGVVVLVVAIALTLRWLHRRAQERSQDERESVWEELDLRRGLRELLARGRRRLEDAVAALDDSLLGRMFVAHTIRRVYAELGLLARGQGRPRLPYQTPYEYLPALRETFPTCSDDVALITEAYVAVHYGEMPERPAALAEVREAWRRIREATGVPT